MSFHSPVFLVVVSLVCVDLLVGRKGVCHALVVRAEGSARAERQKEFTLRCQCDLSPGERIYLVTWSKVNGSNVSTIFQKFSPHVDSSGHAFYGSWTDRRAMYNIKTLADVTLAAGDVIKDDAGLYRCEVRTGQSTAHDDVAVQVLYGPGSSTQITSSTGSPTVKEGEAVNLTCTAECLPSCHFRWTCSGCAATRDPVVTLPSVQRDQAGVYTCIVYNTVSRGRADITLDVQYAAAIKDIDFAGGGKTLKLSEGQTATIACRATGNPPPTSVAWSVTGQPKLSNKTFEMRYGRDYSSVYMLKSVSCYDNDLYTCATTNEIDSAHNASVHLLVECAPRHDPAIHDHQLTPSRVVSFTASANVSLTVTARPRPDVQWIRFTEDSVTRVECCYDVIYDDVRAMCTTEITLPANSSEKYGNYTVLIENEKGIWIDNFTVFTDEPPQCPDNVTINNVTTTSFCLDWTPGFDGGAEQTFLLTYSARNDDVKTIFDGVVEDGSEGTKIACVEGLKDATEYMVVLEAENIFGISKNWWAANITTLGDMTGTVLASTVGPWLKVGTPLAVFLTLLAGILIYFLTTRKKRMQNKIPEITFRITEPTEPYCNEGTRFCRLDDKGRRPSTTPSANIYMDVLGEPVATYVNQDESLQPPLTQSCYDTLTRDDDSSNNYEPLSNQSQYIDMTQGVRGHDAIRTSSIINGDVNIAVIENDINLTLEKGDDSIAHMTSRREEDGFSMTTKQGETGVGMTASLRGDGVSMTSARGRGVDVISRKDNTKRTSTLSENGSTYRDAWNVNGNDRNKSQRMCVRSVSNKDQDGMSPRTVIARSIRPSTERLIRPRTVHGDSTCMPDIPSTGINTVSGHDVPASLTQETEEEDIYDVIRDSDLDSMSEDDALYRDGQSHRETLEQHPTYTNIDAHNLCM